MTDFRATLERLYARSAYGRKLGLERMERVAGALGHPEQAFEVVHVGGTNGKGSVCAFVASMAQAGGRRVGMYTSPHLVRLAERVQIGGAPLDDDVLAELIDGVLDRDPELTFFEVMTLVALLAFRDAKVDLAVVEVGLGGRLDATNIVPPPRVAAITRVAFDHMAELGDTLAAIGREKAGIIKPGSAVVLGRLHPDARDVIAARIEEVGARLIPLGSPEPIVGAPLAYPRMAMLGTNLAVAVSVGRELGLTPETMANGIEATSWPGRNELLHRNGQELAARLRAQPRRSGRALARDRSERPRRHRLAARRGPGLRHARVQELAGDAAAPGPRGGTPHLRRAAGAHGRGPGGDGQLPPG